MGTESLRSAIERALADLAIDVDPDSTERLVRFGVLLQQHGAVHNLVGTLDDQRVANELIGDSLVALRWLVGARAVVDVGSGAGIPGLALACALPSTPFVLVEPRRKRIDFLTAARRTLGLTTTVTLVEGDDVRIRREIEHGVRDPFTAAVSRAVFAPAEWVARGAALVEPGGCVCAWRNEREPLRLPEGIALAATQPYTLPTHTERHVERYTTGTG